MKKSFLSITMLVVSISMVVMFICGTAAYAQGPQKNVQNKTVSLQH